MNLTGLKQTKKLLLMDLCKSTQCDYTPGLSAEGAGKNTHIPDFYWKRSDCILYKPLPEDPASNQHASRG